MTPPVYTLIVSLHESIDPNVYDPRLFVEPVTTVVEGLRRLGILDVKIIPRDALRSMIKLHVGERGVYFLLHLHRDVENAPISIDVSLLTEAEAENLKRTAPADSSEVDCPGGHKLVVVRRSVH